jgi:hypothetical protein
LAVKVMQSIGQMSTQASHSMHSLAVNTVCTSQFRQRWASARRAWVEAELDLDRMLAALLGLAAHGTLCARRRR